MISIKSSIQILGTLAILVSGLGSVAKTLAMLAFWGITFIPVSSGELAFFAVACGFFTAMDAGALKNGIFSFSKPDVLGMPYYEFFLWGFYLLHTYRTVDGPAPRQSKRFATLVFAVAFALLFGLVTDQALLLEIGAPLLACALLVFREPTDFLYAGYMVALGAVVEYTGVLSGTWSYPDAPIGGVPLWFIVLWGAVGLLFRRIVVSTLHRLNGRDRRSRRARPLARFLVLELLKALPEGARHRLIRKKLRFDHLDPSEWSIGLATTQEELEAAFGLLHESYVGQNLMAPHPSGLRCNLYSALPNTTVLIVKRADCVVGTVSLIRDSEFGLPSDSHFRRENNALRRKGRSLVEVSALAIAPSARNAGHQPTLHLMKALYLYAAKNMECDTLVATVHPEAYDFYAAIFGFVRKGEIVEYGFVKGALATHIAMEMTEDWYRRLANEFYRNCSPSQSLLAFASADTPALRLPEVRSGSLMTPVMTPELLKYFLSERTNLLQLLTDDQSSLIKNAYETYFGKERMAWMNARTLPRRTFRHPVKAKVAVLSDSGDTIGTIMNISEDGLFVATSVPLRLGRIYRLIFDIGTVRFITQGTVRWENRGEQARIGYGFGVSFATKEGALNGALQSLYSIRTNSLRLVA